MNDQMRQVWERLEGFDVDEGRPALRFAARLARENGWDEAFAERVVTEYKRFLLLAVTAGHPVTPSDQVDQAWHLHMAYTRSYWGRLCGQTLGRSLHHDPTRGGETEDHKFDDWYQRTLETYTRAFGHAPPADIWPAPEVRFDPGQRWVRVNLGAPRSGGLGRPAMVGAAAAAGLFTVGCTPVMLGHQSGLQVPLIFAAVIGLMLLGAVIYRLKTGEWPRSGSGSGCGSGCSAGGCGSGGSGCGSGCSGGGGCGGGGCGGGGD